MAQEITLKRTFDAPRELVFKAWTDPKLVSTWWSPHGFSVPACEMDVRPGGAIHMTMRAPDASEYPMTGAFQEVDAPRKLVFTTGAVPDEKGSPQLETRNTVTFNELGGKTEITLHVVVTRSTPAADGALAGMEIGWNQSLDKLVHSMGYFKEGAVTGKTILTAEPGKQQTVLTRVFDAPREFVFKAFTDPALIAQWWGPRDLTTTVDRLEARAGGIWRYVQQDASGGVFAFHGVYHEITAPARLVFTFEFEGMPGHAALETVTLEEQEGKTLLTDKSVYQSVEDRDGMLYSGMEIGAAESMDRLAEILVRV